MSLTQGKTLMVRLLDGNDSIVFVCIDDSGHFFLIVYTNEIPALWFQKFPLKCPKSDGQKSWKLIAYGMRAHYHLKKIHTIATVDLGTPKFTKFSLEAYFYDNFAKNKSRSPAAHHRLLIGYGYIGSLKNLLSAVI